MSDFATGRVIPGNSDILPVSYGDDSGLYVEFYTREVLNEQKSTLEGRPIYESKEYVKIMGVGDKTKQWDRPVRKTSDGNTPSDLQRFPRQWQAFLNQDKQVLEGTPIIEWPAITRADAMSLKAIGIHTIEMLANLGEHNMTFMGARMYRDKAKAWIEKAKEGAGSLQWAQEKKAMQDQIDALTNQMKGLMSAGVIQKPLPAQVFDVQSIQEASAPPVRRGRPPKVNNEQDIPPTDATSG